MNAVHWQALIKAVRTKHLQVRYLPVFRQFRQFRTADGPGGCHSKLYLDALWIAVILIQSSSEFSFSLTDE